MNIAAPVFLENIKLLILVPNAFLADLVIMELVSQKCHGLHALLVKMALIRVA